MHQNIKVVFLLPWTSSITSTLSSKTTQIKSTARKMQMLTLLLPLFAVLAATQSHTVPSYSAPSKCATTMWEMPGCCPPIAAHTATSYVDCKGCELDVQTRGFHCLVACPSTTTTNFASTTTVKKCGASSTFTTKPAPSPCVTIITSWKPPCGGCLHTEYATTETASVDCGGCALEVKTTKINAGVCIQCVQGPQTTTKSEATTVTSCAVSARATPTY